MEKMYFKSIVLVGLLVTSSCSVKGIADGGEQRFPNQVTADFGKGIGQDSSVGFVRSDFNKKGISLDEYISRERSAISVGSDEYLVFVKVGSNLVISKTGIIITDGKTHSHKEFGANSLSVLKINRNAFANQKIIFSNAYSFVFSNEYLGRMTSDALVDAAIKDYSTKAKNIIQMKVFDTDGKEVFIKEEEDQAKIRKETLMEDAVLGLMIRSYSIKK